MSLNFSAFSGTEVFRGSDHLGEVPGPIFLDQLNCNGDEKQVLACNSIRPLGLHACSHAEDVGVRCIGMWTMHTIHVCICYSGCNFICVS